MSYRIIQDLDLCDGHGRCVLAAPHVFEIGGDDDVSRIITETPPDSELENVRTAVGSCPKWALSIEFEAG
jgi:ferredoxin